jgi:hypothetical protein
MKILILLLLSFQLQAASLGQYISSPEGSSIQTITVNKNLAMFDKKSNFFDLKKEYSLGKFEAQSADLLEEEKVINSNFIKIKEVDDFLKKKHSDFNELSHKKPHESFLFIENFRISQASDMYPELKKAFDALQGKNWKHISGIKLTADLKYLVTVKGGKEISREPFNLPFHCKNDQPPTICSFKDLGIIYIDKK